MVRDKEKMIVRKSGTRPTPEVYKEMVEVMDEGIGKILNTLSELDLEKNTFILFLSDNGGIQTISRSPLRGGKGSLWEGGHRVPAVVYWPDRIKPQSITDEPCMSMDILPTILDVCRLPQPQTLALDGVSLYDMLLNSRRLPKRTLFWREFYKILPRVQKAVRYGPWKLIINPRIFDTITKDRLGTNQPEVTWLFNLKRDPAEKRNLAKVYPKRVKKMLKLLARWEQDVDRYPQ
jgi:arylsulfatase A-like enzyme